MSLEQETKYTPGIVAQILSFLDVAATFRDVAQIGLEYLRGDKSNMLVIGEFRSQLAHVINLASYEGMPVYGDEEALRMLEQERDKAFSSKNIALVVNGKVKVRGE